MERYKILRVNGVFDKPYLFFESTPSIYLKKAELEYIIFIDNNNNKISIFYFFINWVF